MRPKVCVFPIGKMFSRQKISRQFPWMGEKPVTPIRSNKSLGVDR